MIPVWGSGRDLINDIQTGDVGGSLMNAGFLIWDVASIAVGVVSFGTGTVAMQGAKAGVKGAIKAGAKAISKEALQQMGKAALKKLSKEALKKSVMMLPKSFLKPVFLPVFRPEHLFIPKMELKISKISGLEIWYGLMMKIQIL